MTGSLRSMKREKAGKSERGNKMQLATSMNIGKVMDEEAKRCAGGCAGFSGVRDHDYT